jgi:hypothetical protein
MREFYLEVKYTLVLLRIELRQRPYQKRTLPFKLKNLKYLFYYKTLLL